MTDPRQTLTVLQSIDSLEVVYDRAGTVVYRNGETVRDEKERIFSDWREGIYVVERQPAKGATLTEIFQLTSDGSQLIWVVSLEAEGKEVVITRVYDETPEPVTT